MQTVIRFACLAWLGIQLVSDCEAAGARRYSTGVVGTFGQNRAGTTRPAPQHVHRAPTGTGLGLGGGMGMSGISANSLGISSASTGIPSAGSMTGLSGAGFTGTANHRSARNYGSQYTTQNRGLGGFNTKARTKLITPNSRP